MPKCMTLARGRGQRCQLQLQLKLEEQQMEIRTRKHEFCLGHIKCTEPFRHPGKDCVQTIGERTLELGGEIEMREIEF